jgi:hypothetical protein
VHIQLPQGTTFAGTTSDTLTVEGDEVVVTLGRIGAGSEQAVEIPALVAAENRGNERLVASSKVSSSTALPIHTNVVITHVAR